MWSSSIDLRPALNAKANDGDDDRAKHDDDGGGGGDDCDNDDDDAEDRDHDLRPHSSPVPCSRAPHESHSNT